jgi:rRNA-processing protein FCF1
MDEPYELCVLDKTLDELEKIMAEQSGKHKLAARLAKSLILHNRLVVLQTTGTSSKTSLVDDYLISFSGKDTIIATQDANLKKHVAEKGGRLIILRNKDHLEIK